jgi:hypothetical protein
MALAMFAVALLLSACGGGSGQADRFGTDPSGAASTATSRASEPAKLSEPGNKVRTYKGKAEAQHSPGSGSVLKVQSDSALNHSSPTRSSEDCPQGVSKRVCAQVAEIRKQQPDNPSTQKTLIGKCPAAMSRSVCKAVTRGYKEGQRSGPRLIPGHCPPMLSQVQCAELAKAFARAMK